MTPVSAGLPASAPALDSVQVDTALYEASKRDNKTSVKSLLKSQQFRLSSVGLALQFAIQHNNFEVAQILITHLRKVRGGIPYLKTPFELACQQPTDTIAAEILQSDRFKGDCRESIRRAYEEASSQDRRHIKILLLRECPWIIHP